MSLLRRGHGHSRDSADLARWLLRGAIGGTLVAHGVRHGRTIPGTAAWFESIGFRHPSLQARLSSAVEVGAGTGIIIGAATPLSSAAVVGTMAVAARTVHQPNGFFIVSEGWEYVAFISASAIALSALGSGKCSIDRATGIDRIGTPTRRAIATAVLGIGGAAAQLATFLAEAIPGSDVPLSWASPLCRVSVRSQQFAILGRMFAVRRPSNVP